MFESLPKLIEEASAVDDAEHTRLRTTESFIKTYGIIHPAEQYESDRDQRLAPMHESQQKLGAVFFETAGWERPHWYESNAELLEDPRFVSGDYDTGLVAATELADLILPAEGDYPAPSKLGTPAFINEWISAPYPDQHRDRVLIVNGLAWPSDVIGGWAFGLFWTMLLLRLSGHSVDEGTLPGPGHSFLAREGE